ncbi:MULTISPECIES: hypothetical protein [unclassified Ruminococcus]|uniref:hypothetical protein n=1 Tax=unclassified Ruminococcus TaxID=2608920 RepID=UPI002108B50A|nr:MULTISPECIES: hypothetical protein [unclassified Ruminococcus]MCQ4021515.1 hypothetical protein [Ruminococcus sp. zg-924]MCQ4113960.1 hypothetical protein [Ruminococcus sp. zg-921]
MKKTSTSLFRTLILFLVLLVTVFILVMAWFTSKSEATADGLSVKAAQSSGLEVSFDGQNNWDYDIVNNTQKAYPLVTGSGVVTNGNIDLFMPKLNRTVGEPVLTDGVYQGISAEEGKHFFETDVYFRSTEALDVSISSESQVTPKKITERLSEFGNFSRDYIAGAARVGVYDKDDKLKFVWAPNEKYQLSPGSEFVEIRKNAGATGGGLNSNPEITFGINTLPQTDGTNYYYMWEVKTVNSGDNQNKPVAADSGKTNPQGIVMRYNSTNKKYYAALDLSSTMNLDHGLYPVKLTGSEITNLKPSNTPRADYADIAQYKGSEECTLSNITVNNHLYNYIGLYFDNEKYIQCSGDTNSRKWAKLTIDANPDKSQFFSDIDRFQILVEYDPTKRNGNGSVGHMKIAEFAFYNSTTGGYGGGTIGFGEGSDAFSLTDGENVVLASPNTNPSSEPTYALVASQETPPQLSSLQISLDATTVTEEGATRDTYRINPQSRPIGSDFSVISTANVGEYKFKHNESNYYLYDNGGTLSLTADEAYATAFQLTNGNDYSVDGKNFTLCRLKSTVSSKYLSIDVTGAYLSPSVTDTRIFINSDTTTNNYTFNANGTPQTDYMYLNKGNTPLSTSLTKVSTAVSAWSAVNPTSKIVTNLNAVSGLPIVSLTKANPDDAYYTGHIKVRIWIEGTDREAKTPLVNGIFNTKLVFNKLTTTT